MIDHKPWIPSDFGKGLFNGERIVIVGHSHHGDGVDDDDKTLECIEHVTGRWDLWNLAFFNHIRNYFGHGAHAEFWSKVAFFNYAPAFIGTSTQRYARMSDPAIIRQASERFGRILNRTRPTKTFVFSRAIAHLLPLPAPARHPLCDAVRTTIFVGNAGEQSPVYLLRHPERAPKLPMISAVQAMLNE